MNEHKDSVWMFFEEHIVPAIRRYQIETDPEMEEADGLTKVKFEKHLMQAISEEHPSKVLKMQTIYRLL